MHEILSELLENVNVTLSESDMKELIEKMCHDIMNKASIQDILNKLIESLHLEPTQEQQETVEEIAEMLHSMEELEVCTYNNIFCVCLYLFLVAGRRSRSTVTS